MADSMAEILQTIKDLKEQVSSLTEKLTVQQPCHCHKSRRRSAKKQTRRAPVSETGRDGVIKWYSRRLAYGFITRGDNSQEVFIALDISLRGSATCLRGRALSLITQLSTLRARQLQSPCSPRASATSKKLGQPPKGSLSWPNPPKGSQSMMHATDSWHIMWRRT